MERIEEFTNSKKKFVYIDLSEFKTNKEIKEFLEASKPLIEKYVGNTVHTITNVKNLRLDTETKNIIVDWVEHNQPYVKCGAIIGIDGIKKIFAKAIFSLSGRKNLFFASSKEEAIELLLHSPVSPKQQ